MVSPTLLSLPPEILSLIIKEVDAQDDAFRAVAQDWYTPASEVVLQLKSESNGRGVSSLYSSCKTLSSLAAPYLFQVSAYDWIAPSTRIDVSMVVSRR